MLVILYIGDPITKIISCSGYPTFKWVSRVATPLLRITMGKPAIKSYIKNVKNLIFVIYFYCIMQQ